MNEMGGHISSSEKHEYYRELCALATSGTLTDKEWVELHGHVRECADCRVALGQYREIARTGMALLMSEPPPEENCTASGSWSPEVAKKELLARIAQGDTLPQHQVTSSVEPPQKQVRWWRSLFRPAPPLVPRIAAAAALLLLALTLGAYRLGKVNGKQAVSLAAQSSEVQSASLQNDLIAARQNRAVLESQLAAHSAELDRVAAQLRSQKAEVDKWQALQAKTEQDLARQTTQNAELQAQSSSAMAERDEIGRHLAQSQASLKALQDQLAALQQQRSREADTFADLQATVVDLSTRLHDSEARVKEDEHLLASDRDIRELMGARELYIADVFDVRGDGQTQKPYGRIFYTRQKSLIFYAFDLDQQPGVRDASIFQAWGRRGMHDKKPLNMGVLYLDNQSKKRWVLRFDDPQALAHIDAVFVTVEPHPGSSKPSGEQLLFASLRSAPNHP